MLPAEDFEKYICQNTYAKDYIEQALMKIMKVQGGLTRGRGITNSTLLDMVYFICALPPCIPIMGALKKLSGMCDHSIWLTRITSTVTSKPEKGPYRSC